MRAVDSWDSYRYIELALTERFTAIMELSNPAHDLLAGFVAF